MRKIILSCEHASAALPRKYLSLFAKLNQTKDIFALDLLKSHYGFDLGALEISQHLAKLIQVPLFTGSYSRLLIDLNRSLHNPSLFSRISRRLDAVEKEIVKKKYYEPFRQSFQASIYQYLENKQDILHLSIHSFTPELNNKLRQAEMGILYDPQIGLEKKMAENFKQSFFCSHPNWQIRFNWPYRGISDGHTTYWRKTLKTKNQINPNYIGLELEFNQKLFIGKNKNSQKKTSIDLANNLAKSIEVFNQNSLADSSRFR